MKLKTNRALVFGIFKPGEMDLAQALDAWDESSNIVDFIETEFKKFCIDIDTLKNEVGRVIYVRYNVTGQCLGYSLMQTSPNDIAIELNDHHPLTQFVSKYQDKVRIGGIYANFSAASDLDAFNWSRLRSTGRELFNRALGHYRGKRQSSFLESRQAFLNFFHDPLCLAGAWLDTLLSASSAPSDGQASSQYQPLPIDNLDLPLLPPILPVSQRPQAPVTDESQQLLISGTPSESLPSVVENASGSASHQLLVLRDDIKNHPDRGQGKFLPVASRTLLNKLGVAPDQMQPQSFLLLCLSDDRLLEYYDKLAKILIDEAHEALQQELTGQAPLAAEIENWRKNFSSLLNNEFQTVGNLLAGIDGLYHLSRAFEGISKDERPEIIIPNCSLSKLYERDAIRQKFETLLYNANSSKTNLQNYIGICIVPKIAYAEEPADASQESMFGDDPRAARSLVDLGDAAGFSHLVAFMKYCEEKSLRIMTFASLANELPGYRLSEKTLEDAFLLDAIRQLEKSAGQRVLKHISICIPDKIFMAELNLDFGFSVQTPLIVTKAAFLVAAIAMRNDSVSKLRQMLGPNERRYLQNDEPGLAIGPQTVWGETEMYRNSALRELFELPVPSDLNMEARLMEQLLSTENKRYSCFSLLQHEKGRNIFLRLFNTPFWEGNQYYSVSLMRLVDYLSNMIRKSSNPADMYRELDNPKPRGKTILDKDMRYINTWRPDKVIFDVTQFAEDQQQDMKVKIK